MDLITQRGGLLLWPSTASVDATTTTTATVDHVDALWDYVQPLLLPSSSCYQPNGTARDSNSITLERCGASTWQSKILQWHLDKQQQAQQQHLEKLRKQQQEADNELYPRRRGRRKRKKEESTSLITEETTLTTQGDEDPLKWYSDVVLANSSMSHKRQRMPEGPLSQKGAEEQKAHSMQHFWLRHRGKLGRAHLETRVQLSAGKGTNPTLLHVAAFHCSVVLS